MNRWGAWLATRPVRVLVASLALVALAAGYGMGVFDRLANGGFEDPASELARATEAFEEEFPDAGTDIVVSYHSDRYQVSDTQFADRVQDVVDGLDPDIATRVTTWWDTRAPGLVGDDGHATRVLISLAGDDETERMANYDLVVDDLNADGLQTDVGGQYAVFDDVNATVGADIARAEMFAMPIVFLLSLIIFGSVTSALMPTLVGGAAVMGAFAAVRGVTEVTEVSVFAINVITLLGMGLAIDYSLFVVSRFREELGAAKDRASVRRAITRTMATAGRTVLFSGVIVAASLASLLMFPQVFLRSMGYGGIAAVVVAMTASLTLLPAVLAVLGQRINLGRLPGRRSLTERAADGVGAWARIAGSVMRRPLVYLLPVLAGLVALGVPFLGADFGPVDERVLPADSPSRVAAAQQEEWFGADSESALVVVEDAAQAEVAAYSRDLGDVPGVTGVQPVAESGSAAALEVAWEGTPESEASHDIVEQLRDIPAPEGATALVGGEAAATVDLFASLGAHLPWMAGIVVVVMLVLLFVAFGSVVLPLKAVAMNVLSLGASFGVVTWIFADGNLEDLLGFTSTGYLDATQPILMLAILFGLSMDYEVFLLSRVREEWDRTGDNTTAVRSGVQRTGAIITSAALLLSVVVGGFATSGIVFLKMIGVGMLVALLIDATIVRAVLVPATMRLLGSFNWWAPGPLARWWERHGHREESAEPGIVPAAGIEARDPRPLPVG